MLRFFQTHVKFATASTSLSWWRELLPGAIVAAVYVGRVEGAGARNVFNLSPERAAQLRRNFRGLSVIVFALTAAQAFLGSAGFFRGGDSIDYTTVHEIIANALFPLAIILFGLVFLAQFERRNQMLFWTGLLLILIISQIGLGYSSRNDITLLAWHIPSGVAIFGAALVVMLLSFGLRLTRD